MATQITNDGHVIAPLNITAPAPVIELKGFHWGTVDHKIEGAEFVKEHTFSQRVADPTIKAAPQPDPSARPASPQPVPASQLPLPGADVPEQVEFQLGFRPKLTDLPKPPPPFPLTLMQGAFAGNGFNSIFRPRSKVDTDPNSKDDFVDLKDKPIGGPRPPGIGDNILELNLTLEQWSFGKTIGNVPNRGLNINGQPDITLRGFPYMQTVQDATDKSTGRSTNPDTTDIHFETGMFLVADECTVSPKCPSTVIRMASIPHGTTINAQGLAGQKTAISTTNPIGGVAGPPKFDTLDTRPVNAGDGSFTNPIQLLKRDGTTSIFTNMDPSNQATFRLPQKLEPYINAGTITKDIIQNPNVFLAKAIENQKIIDTITFTVNTGKPGDAISGGGTSNIAFLTGPQVAQANAHVPFVKSTFRIETVEYEVNVKEFSDSTPRLFKPVMPNGKDGTPSTAPTPDFIISPPAILPSAPQKLFVRGIQIQYSQTVILNFAGISWPHVSCATLVPKDPQPFQMK